MSKTHETCAEKVGNAAFSRLYDLRAMLLPERDMVALGDDGTMDTVLWIGDDIQYSLSDTSDYRDENGALDLDSLIDDEWGDITEYCYERFSEYGLSFDYVPGYTDFNPGEGYWRFQISCGGPSEEIRFFGESDRFGKAEFWYLDWFDGASTDVSDDAAALAMWDTLSDCGSLDHAQQEAYSK